MIRALALIAMTTPAAAELPYAPGEHLVQTQLFDAVSGKLTPNAAPRETWPCFQVTEITETRLTLTLLAGDFPMQRPSAGGLISFFAPAGTKTGYSASASIFEPCKASLLSLLTTPQTTCDMTRLFTRVASCTGRPAPKE